MLRIYVKFSKDKSHKTCDVVINLLICDITTADSPRMSTAVHIKMSAAYL